jgi:hypothetical protein
MTDRSATINISNVADYVYNSTDGMLYVATGDGYVYKYNPTRRSVIIAFGAPSIADLKILRQNRSVRGRRAYQRHL